MKKTTRRASIKIPGFLSHVVMSERQHAVLKKPMANWIVLGKYITAKGLTVKLIEQMLVFEISSEAPRQNIIDKLMSRYNSARRKEVIAQVDKVLSHPSVIKSKKQPRKKAAKET